MSTETHGGRFFAKENNVFRSPVMTKVDGGHTVSIGFKVCTISEYVSNDTAVIIANALNGLLDKGELT